MSNNWAVQFLETLNGEGIFICDSKGKLVEQGLWDQYEVVFNSFVEAAADEYRTPFLKYGQHLQLCAHVLNRRESCDCGYVDARSPAAKGEKR